MLASGDTYASIVRLFIDDQRLWVFPHPLRWSYLGAARLFCAFGDCTHRTLATLSTVAGIAAVALTYRLGLQLFERRTALVAAALMATSPLQLAMGRRALTDEFFCAMVLGALVAMMSVLGEPSPGASRHPLPRSGRGALVVTWILATTFAFGAKELFLLTYPLVLLFWWLRERRVRWVVWALPPFLYYAVFCALAGDVTSFFRVANITISNMGAPYAAQFQNGPPHRLLIDLLAVAPLVTIAFIAAAAAVRAPEQRRLLLLAGGILVVQSLLSSKNLRYVISADPLMRILVASWLPRGRWLTVALIANAVAELAIFYVIFIAGDVYDPVTQDLLGALKMLPH